jgi:ABC-type transport system substrate-binding protein
LSRRQVIAGAGGLAVAGGTVALPRRSWSDARRGGVLRVCMPFNPSSLDPSTGRVSPEFTALFAIYDGLLQSDPQTGEVQPGLAKAFTYKDSQTLVLDLVEGVSFHDGTPFDAEAVKFNLERSRTHPRTTTRADLDSLASVEVVSKYQAVIHLNRPNAGFAAILTDRVGLMVSPTAFKSANENMDRKPVGTGAFKFVSWQDNDSVVLTRNENYWRAGLPYLDGVTIRIIPEMQTDLRSIVAGENDLALYLDISLKPSVDRSPGLNAILTQTTLLQMIYLNYGRPPLDDVRVRQALNYGVNREELSQVISQGLQPPTSALYPKSHWTCEPETANYYSYDPAKAKSLLADAGYPNRIEIPMLGFPDQTNIRFQELMMAQLERAGIRLKITRGANFQTSTDFFGPEKKGAGRISPSGGRADPGQFYSQLYSKNAFYNAGGKESPGFPELLAATEAATDPAARKAAFYKLQHLTVTQGLTVPMLITVGLSVATPKVQGLVIDSLLKPKFTEVSLAA